MRNIFDFLSEKKLVSLISFGPFIFIPLVVTVVSVFLLHINKAQYLESLRDMHAIFLEGQKSKIVSKVDMAAKWLEYRSPPIAVNNKIMQEDNVSKMQMQSLEMLRQMFFNRSDYFFVIDTKGNNIMNGQGFAADKANILSITDMEGKEFVKELIKSAHSQSPDFISYKIRNPKNGTVQKKYSYVQKVKNSDWIVGSGFYYEPEKNEQLLDQEKNLMIVYEKHNERILWFSFALLIVSAVISFMVSIALKNRLTEYAEILLQKNNELIKLNFSLEQKVQKRTEELNKAYADMHEIAITDELTKVYNRYFFNDALKNEINRANRYLSGFALCMLDIDHFKNVNDTYGHSMGDKVLKKVTQIIKKHLRDSDIFARVGGEEFMVIFPNTLKSASAIVERIRESVEEHTFKEIGKVTISIGLVAYRHKETQEELLKRVDTALYSAKEAGRNTVVIEK